MDDFLDDYYNIFNIDDDPSLGAIENVFDLNTGDDAINNIYGNNSAGDGAINNIYGSNNTGNDAVDNICGNINPSSDATDNIYGNISTGDDGIDNIYGNINTGDDAMDNIYGNISTVDDAIDNIYGNISTGDGAMDNMYGIVSSGDGAMNNVFDLAGNSNEDINSVGACVVADESPHYVTISLSTPKFIATTNSPQQEEIDLDPSRVQVTYEAHPQYFPCRERDDQPIPQLIQNHEERSRASSSCSSRISSSTGDYLESSDSWDGFESPDENDADDEKDSSGDNDDRGSLITAGKCEDMKDDFGDDECSDNEKLSKARKILINRRHKRSAPNYAGGRSDDSGSSSSSSSSSSESYENNGDKEPEADDASSAGLGPEEVENNSVDLDYPYREKGLRIDLAKEGFHSDFSEYTDIENLGVGREEIIDDLSTSTSEDIDSGDVDLVTTVKRNFNRPTPICEPAVPQTATHISALPLEMIFYILRWVVTEDLDLTSLERFSRVCRGFYICSRDSELWKSACMRVWGSDENLSLVPYSSWRTMYLSRPRLNFNGCYVSKSVYVRYEEDKLRDRFYRPWNVIHNYKYLRFFPEGLVILLRTHDKNRPLSDYLNRDNTRGVGCLMGYYKLHNDQISLIFARSEVANNMRIREILYDISNGMVGDSYRMELQILSARNWFNGVLMWRAYAITNRRGYSSSETELDVRSQKYPPFWFSRFRGPSGHPVGPL